MTNQNSFSGDFESLNLPPFIMQALAKLEFTKATPVQQKAIPVVMEGKDLISTAETGSGKTAAFLIPTLVRQTEPGGAPVLIISPTRELAAQIYDSLRALTQFAPHIHATLLMGGAPIHKQARSLSMDPNFVVATPGRLIDHAKRRSIILKDFKTLIIDEADRMFDMGFIPQVREIVRGLPKDRQTLLFSATFPQEVKTLAREVLRSPVEIKISSPRVTPNQIAQKSFEMNQDKKNDFTYNLISSAKGSVLIFTRTKIRTDRLANYLADKGLNVARLHGDRTQGQRNMAIAGFRSGQYNVMVATDIAARGIDVDSVSDVINYDIPVSPEDYLHRIGRTGRAGRSGSAHTLLTKADIGKWQVMSKTLQIK